MFLLFGEEGRRTRRGSRFVGAETSKNACIFICEATPDASAEYQRGALSLLAHQRRKDDLRVMFLLFGEEIDQVFVDYRHL